MWLYLALGVVIVAYLLFKRTYSYWDRNEIPSVPGMLLFGSIWQVLAMRKHIGILAQEWYQQFSNLPYFGYYNCSTPVLMVRDVDIVKDVLIKDFNAFSTNDFKMNEENDPLLATNPFMVTGEKWKYNRSILSPLFSTSKVKTVYPKMKTTCAKFKDYLVQHCSEDLNSRELAAKFTTENSVMCGFTFNAESFTNPDAEFRTVSRKLFEQTTLTGIKFTITIFVPWLANYLRISVVPPYINSFFRRFVKSNIESRKNAPAEDFLQMLLNSGDTKKLSDTEITGHSLTLFSEGYETSSAVLSHGMFELSRNPDIQNTLYDEITSTLNDCNDDLSMETLQKMEYLDAFVNETLRMYPVLLTMNKVCTIPYEFRPLPGKKIGYKMPVGGVVAIPVHAIHRDHENYPEPDVFNPERFLPEQRKSIHKAAFLGFGEGPRMCVGMRFGQTQVKLALITVVRSFRVKLSPATKPYQVDPAFFMNAPLHPILLNFEKR